jgi:hypothetical protein
MGPVKRNGGIRCALFVASDETQLGSAEHTVSVFTGSGSFTVSVAREGTIEAKMKLTDAAHMKRIGISPLIK